MPSGNATLPAAAPEPSPPPALPPDDLDPVRSPDEPVNGTVSSSTDSSSSLADMDKVLSPPPDEDVRKSKKAKGQPAVPEHHETAQEDESVGGLYLDQHDWKGALSRFESAVVLDPENPDVYWGLAEAQHHLGQLAEAKANYQKVVDYDPDSKHAREAKKKLKDPDLANVTASRR
ncbi:MAG TPA: tetratricopeptide repeat protein [Terracidiphilus sp.]|nr:tetratricopeptide repeat protein [Terracidiphilus sp.]